MREAHGALAASAEDGDEDAGRVQARARYARKVRRRALQIRIRFPGELGGMNSRYPPPATAVIGAGVEAPLRRAAAATEQQQADRESGRARRWTKRSRRKARERWRADLRHVSPYSRPLAFSIGDSTPIAAGSAASHDTASFAARGRRALLALSSMHAASSRNGSTSHAGKRQQDTSAHIVANHRCKMKSGAALHLLWRIATCILVGHCN